MLIKIDNVVLLALQLPRQLGGVQRANIALPVVLVGVLFHGVVVGIFKLNVWKNGACTLIAKQRSGSVRKRYLWQHKKDQKNKSGELAQQSGDHI